MSSTQCKDTKSYEHVNEHTTGRNILTENYHTQQENTDSIKLQINLVSDILLGFISLLNVDEVVSLSFCKVERSRFRFENRLDLKESCFCKIIENVLHPRSYYRVNIILNFCRVLV